MLFRSKANGRLARWTFDLNSDSKEWKETILGPGGDMPRIARARSTRHAACVFPDPVGPLMNTFAFNPIPQTFKPIVETATNFNFFTMRPIIGQGLAEVEPRYQVCPGTSKTAQMLGEMFNVSPMKIDHLLKGYTGTMGGYLTDVIDSMTSQYSDAPKASKRFEQMPFIKRFALDPEARGHVTEFYQLQKSVDTFVRTSNLLEKTARPEEFAKYVQENVGILAVKDIVSDTEKQMKYLRDMKREITSANIPPDEKRDIITDIGQMENNVTSNIKYLKKIVNEAK